MLFLVQEIVAEESVLLKIWGLVGAPGNVDGSGARKKWIFGLVGGSRRSHALHVAFPLREDATHVYSPLSVFSKSTKRIILGF